MKKQQLSHEEWLVLRKKRFDEERWFNALMWYPGTRLGDRYCDTKEEAEKVLAHALKMWNGVKVYGADGKRYERQDNWVTVVCDKRTDRDQEIIAWKIKKRLVTDWETIEKN